MAERRFRLTAQAKRDLLDIGRHTQQQWGRRQRNAYLKRLDGAFKQLTRHPELGRDESEVRAGYRSFPEGRHLIFYRETEGVIEIVRILHQSMDYRARL